MVPEGQVQVKKAKLRNIIIVILVLVTAAISVVNLIFKVVTF